MMAERALHDGGRIENNEMKISGKVNDIYYY